MCSVLSISAGGHSILTIGQVKILGVILNTSLSLTPHIQSFSKSFCFYLQNLEFCLELFLVTRFKIALTKSGYHILKLQLANHLHLPPSQSPLPGSTFISFEGYLLHDLPVYCISYLLFISPEMFFGRSFFFSDTSQVSGTYWTQCVFIEWLDSSFISFKSESSFLFSLLFIEHIIFQPLF